MSVDELRSTMKTTGGIWTPDVFQIFAEGHAEAPRFTKHPDVANGDIVFARLAGIGTKEGETREDHVERLLVGQGWETLDGGKTISHPTDTAFPGFMGFGRWIEWALKQDELLEHVAGRGVKSATEARFWAGLTLELTTVTETFVLKKDGKRGKAGDTVSSSYVVPVKYIADAEPLAPAAPAISTVPTIDDLKALARSCPSHPDFLTAALSRYPALREPPNASLFALVVNQNGLYVEARA